jgi:hypothetical protein
MATKRQRRIYKVELELVDTPVGEEPYLTAQDLRGFLSCPTAPAGVTVRNIKVVLVK